MRFFIFILTFLFLFGCASNVTLEQAIPMEPVGFLSGLFHGYVILFSFIGSLFTDDIAIYAIYNNGGWYDFGYVFGVVSAAYILYDNNR